LVEVALGDVIPLLVKSRDHVGGSSMPTIRLLMACDTTIEREGVVKEMGWRKKGEDKRGSEMIFFCSYFFIAKLLEPRCTVGKGKMNCCQSVI
jgi:hypothetical protein